jgi:ABC-type polysaccharide/polyol phosphate export permease
LSANISDFDVRDADILVSVSLGPEAQPIITYNFMFHLVEVMRAPMLGTAPSLLSRASPLLASRGS